LGLVPEGENSILLNNLELLSEPFYPYLSFRVVFIEVPIMF